MTEIMVLVVQAPGWEALGINLGETARAAVAAARAEADIDDASRIVAVALVDDVSQAELNARHRGKQGATNVLAFPAPDSDPESYGDVVLALETVREEAARLGIDAGAHLSHLIVHGTFHLFGYDHQTEDQAVVMEGMESRAMARLGLHDPYGEPVNAF